MFVDTNQSAFRPVHLGRADIERIDLDGESYVLRSREALQPYPMRLLEKLEYWAGVAPTRVFLAKRPKRGVPWRELTYAQAWNAVRRIGQALATRGLSAERPIVVLSENDLEHAMLALGAMYAGVPYAPISVPYSLQSQDHLKLKQVLGLLTPGMVFVSDGQRYAQAIAATVPAETELVVTANPIDGRACTPFAVLLDTAPGAEGEAAYAATGPDTIAKFLFTSGSTKQPKAVINTQRMLCANQQMILQGMPFLGEHTPVLLDWLPWNHTFGGNHNFGIVLYNGGTLYIDDGKPVPGLVEETLENLREIAPTLYFNVPRGYDALAQVLPNDTELAANFFSRLQLLFYAGASLAPAVWRALYGEAERHLGARVPIITSLGMTESGPAAVLVVDPDIKPGQIGVPMPGVDIKMVSVGGKIEGRYRGPSITCGYWRMPEETAEAFDADGWFRSGDTFRQADPGNLNVGLIFDGRTAEDFKLDSGTWVHANSLRARIAQLAAPYMQDSVITGHDRSEIVALLVPNIEACRALVGLDADADVRTVLRHPKLHDWLQDLIDTLCGEATSSANRIVRLAVVETLLSLDRGEMTDKGSVNQRMVLAHRASLVAALYGEAQADQPIYLSKK